MVREAILNIMADGNMIINRIGKKNNHNKKKTNPNKVSYQQTQIIKLTCGRMEIKKFIRKQS